MTGAPGGGRASGAVILVPLDGSAQARSALPVARGLARLQRAAVHVVHVSEPELPPSEIDRRFGVGPVEAVHTRHGDPAAAILDAAHHGATIVMTSHCGHPCAATGLGHVAERVLKETRAPLVLVPPGRGEVVWDPRALVLPLDGAPGSAAAVRPARQLAKDAGARMVLLHVAGAHLDRSSEPGTYGAPLYADQPQHEWPAWRDEFLDRSTCHDCGPNQRERMQVRVASGAPGATTVKAAEEERADLVVIAWHGVLDEDHAATLRAVLAGVRCPVMVVRAEATVAEVG